MKLILVSIIFLLTVQGILCGCPSDWIYSPHDHKCYKVGDKLTGWNLGEYTCAFGGGHIPSIHSPEENKFVWELGKRVGNYIWVGAAQFGNNPNYINSDTSPFNFEKWKTGRRPAFRRGKRCIKIDAATGLWEQSCCKKKAVPICVKDPKLYPGWGTPTVEEKKPFVGTVAEDKSIITTTKFTSPIVLKTKEDNGDFATGVLNSHKVLDVPKLVKRSSDSNYNLRLKDEGPTNEGSDGFGKVIKLTDTMDSVDASNPILLNPENRERVILTTIRNDNPPIRPENEKDRLGKFLRSPF
uniref:C-type lectin domain-containing protein n=1 Tax=Strongyloides venezuelensis TaxID=75913 RepID=A0A0K0F0Z2_STRVS